MKRLLMALLLVVTALAVAPVAHAAATVQVAGNAFNRVAFTGVNTTRLRVVLQSGSASVGLLEVRAFA
jgi:hypothetical protein